MAFRTAVTLVPSGPQTAPGAGAAVDLGAKSALELLLDVTNVGASVGGLTLRIETSKDGARGWREVREFAAEGAVESQSLVVAGCDRFVRCSWDIQTGDAFTFSVTGNAVLVYTSPETLFDVGIPEAALAGVPIEKLHRGIVVATDFLDSYFGIPFTLPLVAWGEDIRRACAVVVAYDMRATLGVNPEGPDGELRVRYEDLIGRPGQKGWLDKVAASQAAPVGAIDSTPDEDEGDAAVVTDAPRGW